MPFLQVEFRTKGKTQTRYATTDWKPLILEAIEFLTEIYQSMEDRGTMQTTVFVTKQAGDEKGKP